MGGAPDMGAMFAQQAATAQAAEERARSQQLEDREYFRTQAEEEREEQMRRDARLASRSAKEEKRRIEDLASEEQEATDEAIEQMAVVDRDTGFGNMFAALLQGQQSTNSAQGTFGSFLGRTGTAKRRFKMSTGA